MHSSSLQGESKFECTVCFEAFEDETIFILSNCGHVFHKECMKSYLSAELESGKGTLICPALKCKVELPTRDIKSILPQ